MAIKILITGASGEIGNALIDILKTQEIVIAGQYFLTNPKTLNWPSNVIPLYMDLSEPQQAFRLVDLALQHLKELDVLVQLSGDLSGPAHWSELSLEEWYYDLNINLTSVLCLAQATSKYICKSKAGKIVFTSSAFIKRGGGLNSLGYAIAKYGVEYLTKVIAKDLASKNVLVNCIAPGFILSKFSTKKAQRNDQEIKQRINSIPLKKAGYPRDVAYQIANLISCQNKFLTGQVICIDGGDFI